jgi:deazaflavin-dependent oxidoreductase (nitroreductase family)
MPTFNLNSVRDERVLNLTTTGRQSGKLRTIEIWFVVYQECCYVLAEHGHQAHWVQNILSNSHVSIQIKGRRFRGRARILDREQDLDEWLAVANYSRQKYGWGEGWPVAIAMAPGEDG